MASHRFSPADEGKRVCTADGVHLGRVDTLRDGVAHVLPAPGLLDRYGSLLATNWHRRRTVVLLPGVVDSVTEQTVVLSVNCEE